MTFRTTQGRWSFLDEELLFRTLPLAEGLRDRASSYRLKLKSNLNYAGQAAREVRPLLPSAQ